MKSETIKGDHLAWKRLPQYLVRLSLEYPYIFDFVKYETLRAEIDYKTFKEYAWVLWEGKMQMPELRNLGCLSGIMSECISLGTYRKGMAIKEGQSQPQFEEN